MRVPYQHARVALGERLRELRAESNLNGKELAGLLGWQPSKVSRLETGKQRATKDDLQAWAAACGAVDCTAELLARLDTVDSHHQSWRRQMAAGTRVVQDRIRASDAKTTLWRAYESGVIPGLFQTPDYARCVFQHVADIQQTPRDTEESVRARMRRQDVLYEPGKRFRILVWEAALHLLLCPPDVMSGQLDRLCGLVGRDNIEFGVIPLGARMGITAKHGFVIRDDRVVMVETVGSELRLDSAEDVALYLRVWERLNASAVYGAQAHRLIVRARASLDVS